VVHVTEYALSITALMQPLRSEELHVEQLVQRAFAWVLANDFYHVLFEYYWISVLDRHLLELAEFLNKVLISGQFIIISNTPSQVISWTQHNFSAVACNSCFKFSLLILSHFTWSRFISQFGLNTRSRYLGRGGGPPLAVVPILEDKFVIMSQLYLFRGVVVQGLMKRIRGTVPILTIELRCSSKGSHDRVVIG
jgi:hypothetical protein